jgi:signal transduction histidine kinase
MNANEKLRILIVDDEPVNLKLLQRFLNPYYHTFSALNGQVALDLLAQTPVDLILLDIMMPGLSGYEVLQQIRADAGTSDLPVILISALSDAKDVTQGLEIGASDYIIKPIDPDVTLARVQTQMALKQLQDERKRAITELQAAQELKDRLMRIASHDLKGPLMNIRMVGDLFRRFQGEIPGGSEVLGALDASLDTMQTVIEDFLDTAAIYSSHMDLKIGSVALGPVVTSLMKLYQVHANRKHIRVEPTNCEGTVLADPARFPQALGNLVSNAIKYSPPNTTIRLWTDRGGDWIRINVADEGPGIPEEDRSRLFTQFGKLTPRPTGDEASTGLGLWIVKHLVNLQGGEVGADFPPDGGSIFWIAMPSV